MKLSIRLALLALLALAPPACTTLEVRTTLDTAAAIIRAATPPADDKNPVAAPAAAPRKPRATPATPPPAPAAPAEPAPSAAATTITEGVDL